MAEHTPEPWGLKREGVIASKETGSVIATLGYNVAVGSNEDEANAARIVACVNYCADVPAERLTEDSLAVLLEDRDRLVAALSKLQRGPNDPRAHREALDVLQGRG